MSKKPPKIISHFALIDIEKGRKALARHIEKYGHVEVVIYAKLTEPFGHDDGTSVEFCADVSKIEYAA